MGVSQATVAAWENGSQPSNVFETLPRLAEVLGVPLEWFFGLCDESPAAIT
jgi:transcriptional regulator with XRE-family HTH domain